MERPRGWVGLGIAGTIPIVALVCWLALRGGTGDNRLVIPGEADTTAVEVLNGTRVDGLARAITLRLRRAGIDVVYFGTAADSSLDTTRIIIRRGDSLAGVRLRKIIGGGRIQMEPDASLLLDVSVVLGHDVARAGKITP